MGRRDLVYFIFKLKFYFDYGLGFLGYFKYMVVALGITFRDIRITILFGILSSIICFIIGYFAAKWKWIDIQNDISNAYNPFVRQTLKHLSKNKKFK